MSDSQGDRDSFAVNLETGECYCHSACSRGGSLIALEADLGGTSIGEAAKAVRLLIGRSASASSIVDTYNYVDECVCR
jgi:hypothetical protein